MCLMQRDTPPVLGGESSNLPLALDRYLSPSRLVRGSHFAVKNSPKIPKAAPRNSTI